MHYYLLLEAIRSKRRLLLLDLADIFANSSVIAGFIDAAPPRDLCLV